MQKLKPEVESKSIRMAGRRARPKEEDLARQVVNEATKATAARANSAGTGSKGDEQTVEPSARRQKIATPTKGPGDTEIWDLSGEGDCGMRAMAAAQAARKGRKPEDIEARIDTISIAMRVTTYQALKKYQGWKSGWCIQPDENPKTLGGEVPTSAEQWHEAVKARKNMWLDWRQLMALKEDLKSAIVVWEWSGAGEWIQVARFEHSKSNEVIPLLLTGQGDERHFATVKRGAEGYPEEWNSHKESIPT